MTPSNELIEEAANEYWHKINSGEGTKHSTTIFKAGANWMREQMTKEIDGLLMALEYYAKHESVIKEAYHSNDERQITVVHTFINHVANEALTNYRSKHGETNG
jgi:hypothetical protein